MRVFFWRLAAGLLLVCLLLSGGVVGSLHLRPYHDADLVALLVPPPDCPPPCWLGVPANIASLSEAVALLEDEPRLTYQIGDGVNQSRNVVRWWWRGDRRTIAGYLQWHGQSVSVTFGVPLADLWLLLGDPDASFLADMTMYDEYGRRRPFPANHTAYYVETGLIVNTRSGCLYFWDETAWVRFHRDAATRLPHPTDDLSAQRAIACQALRRRLERTE